MALTAEMMWEGLKQERLEIFGEENPFNITLFYILIRQKQLIIEHKIACFMNSYQFLQC